MAKWVDCRTCQGKGEVYQEVKPGKWEWKKCPARCRNGKVNLGTI